MFVNLETSSFFMNLIEEPFISNALLILLPLESLIPLQFLNESEINLYVGIVVMVLSKF